MFCMIEIAPLVRVGSFLQYPEMRDFFQSDLITILRMKKIHMGNFDEYNFLVEFMIALETTNLPVMQVHQQVFMFHGLQRMLLQS